MFEVFGLGADFVFNANGTENIHNITADLNRMHTEMQNGHGNISEYSDNITRFTNVVTLLGGALMSAGIAQTMSTINNVMNAADWQDSMIDATRYMSDTSIPAQNEYNQKLSETAKQFGKTKDEINAATISYMQMGKTTDEALRLVSNASYAGATWDMQADTISEAFRSIKASWKVNMEDQTTFNKYLDIINEVGNTTAATSGEIVSYLNMAGGALASVGKVQLDDAIAMVAAARSANLNVDVFGTAMQTLMNRYSQSGEKYFKILKIKVKDSKGDLISFTDAIDQAAKGWDKYSESQKQAFLSGFGMYHASTLGKYIGAYSEQEKAKEITQKPEQYTGSAQAEFERVTDTFNFALSQLQTARDDLSNSLWSVLLPPFTKILKLATGIVTAISNFAQSHPALTKTIAWVSLLGGIFLIVSGAILLTVGMLNKFTVGLLDNRTAIAQYGGVLQGLSTVFTGFKDSLKHATPTLKQSALRFAKLAAVSGIMYLAWKYDFFNIRTMVEEFTAKLKVSMNEMKHLLSADISISGLQNGLQKLDNSNSVIDRLTAGFTRLGYVIKGVSEGWNNFTLSDDLYHKLVATGLIDVVTQILLFKMRMEHFFKGIKKGFFETRDAINELLQQTIGPVLNWLKENVIFPLLDMFPILKDGFVGFMRIINGEDGVQANKDFETLGMTVGSLIAVLFACKTAFTIFGVVSSIGGAIVQAFSVVPAVIGGIGTAFKFVGIIAKGVFGGMLAGIGTVVAGILGACGIVVTLPAWVVGLIAVAVIGLVVLIITKKDEILEAIKSIPGKILGFIRGLPSKIGQIAGLIFGICTKMFFSIFSHAVKVGIDVLSFISKIPGKILEFFVDLPGHILSFFINLPENFLKLGGMLIDGLIKGILGAFDGLVSAVKEFCGGFIQGFKDALGIHSPSVIMQGIGDNTMQGFENGITGKETDIYNTMTDIGSNLSLKLDSSINGMDTVGANSISELQNGLLSSSDGINNDLFNIGSSAKENLNLGFSGMDTIGYSAMSDLEFGINSNKPVVKNALKNIGTDVNNILNSSFTPGNAGSNIMDKVNSNIEKNKPTALNNMNNFGISMGDTFGAGFSSSDFNSDKLLNNFDKSILSGKDKTVKTMKQAGKSAVKGFQSGVKSGNMQKVANDVIKVFNVSISSSRGLIRKTSFNVGKHVISGITNATKNINILGVKVINNFGLGMSSRRQHIVQIITIMCKDIELTITKTSNKMPSMGSKLVDNFANGIESKKARLKQVMHSLVQTGVINVLSNLNNKTSKWGQNMVNGFADGINSSKKKVKKAANDVIKEASDYMAFHSPAKKGEGRYIILWGQNMVKGFMQGIQNEHKDLNSVMNGMFTAPDVIHSKVEIDKPDNVPISTNIDEQLSISPRGMNIIPDVNKDLLSISSQRMDIVPTIDDTQINSYMMKLKSNADINNSISATLENNPLEEILFQVKFIASVIGKNGINSNGVQNNSLGDFKIQSDVSINSDYEKETQAKVQYIYNQIVNNNNQKVDIKIEAGAIQNVFNISNDKNNNAQELIELIQSIVDDSLMPLLMEKISKLKIVGGE